MKQFVSASIAIVSGLAVTREKYPLFMFCPAFRADADCRLWTLVSALVHSGFKAVFAVTLNSAIHLAFSACYWPSTYRAGWSIHGLKPRHHHQHKAGEGEGYNESV